MEVWCTCTHSVDRYTCKCMWTRTYRPYVHNDWPHAGLCFLSRYLDHSQMTCLIWRMITDHENKCWVTFCPERERRLHITYKFLDSVQFTCPGSSEELSPALRHSAWEYLVEEPASVCNHMYTHVWDRIHYSNRMHYRWDILASQNVVWLCCMCSLVLYPIYTLEDLTGYWLSGLCSLRDFQRTTAEVDYHIVVITDV